MTTEIVLRFNRNQKIMERRKAIHDLEKNAMEKVGSFRKNNIDPLEETMRRGQPRERLVALYQIIIAADAISSEIMELKALRKKTKEDKGIKARIAMLNEYLFVCRSALEYAAAFSSDQPIRLRAFEFIKDNPIALKIILGITEYPDMRGRASKAIMENKDTRFGRIVTGHQAEPARPYDGISMRIVAHLQKGSMDEGQRKELMKSATEKISRRAIRWSSVKEVVRDIRRTLTSRVSGNGRKPASGREILQLAKDYLKGMSGAGIDEYEQALDKVRNMRMR